MVTLREIVLCYLGYGTYLLRYSWVDDAKRCMSESHKDNCHPGRTECLGALMAPLASQYVRKADIGRWDHQKHIIELEMLLRVVLQVVHVTTSLSILFLIGRTGFPKMSTQTPDSVNDPKPGLRAFFVFMIVITITSVSLRLWSRLLRSSDTKQRYRLWIDDWLAFAAAVGAHDLLPAEERESQALLTYRSHSSSPYLHWLSSCSSEWILRETGL